MKLLRTALDLFCRRALLFALLSIGLVSVAGCSDAMVSMLPVEAQTLVQAGEDKAMDTMVKGALLECRRSIGTRKETYAKLDDKFAKAGLPQQAPLDCGGDPGPDFEPPQRE